MRRNPKNYDGCQKTTHHLSDLISGVLGRITENFEDRPDLILLAWPDVIGPHLAPMTEAISFRDGFLTVVVKNSTLYSLLSRKEKPKLVQALKAKFPKVFIKTILFRIG